MSDAALTEFLLAQIAEDEKAARHGVALADPVANVYGSFDPERVLAECEAKRHALIFAEAVQDDIERLTAFDVVVLDKFARILALRYADHPDYRDEWKP